MRISARFFFQFKQYAPGDESRFSLELAPGSTVEQALAGLEVPAEGAKVTLINGRQAKPGDELREGDYLVLFPPLEGG